MASDNTQQQPIQDVSRDYLRAYRDRILFHLSLAGMVLLLPLGLLNLYRYNLPAGICIFLILAIVSIDAYHLRKGKQPPIPPSIIIIPVLVGISFGIERLDFIAAMWLYPVMILFFFILPRFTANMINVLASITITVLAYLHDLTVEVMLWFFSTTMLTIIFINLILNVLDTMFEKLHKAALADDLTGAYNRRHMNARLIAAQEYAKRYQTSSSVLLLDVDNFKAINDKYGHSTGDQVLKQMVDILRASLRKVDSIFRVGGDEFLMLLPETGHIQAMNVAEKLCGILANVRIIDNQTITTSIGVGEIKPDEDIEALLRRCDVALYQAKRNGRNQAYLSD